MTGRQRSYLFPLLSALVVIGFYQCRGMKRPADYPPLEDTIGNYSTGGLHGNRRTRRDDKAVPPPAPSATPATAGIFRPIDRNSELPADIDSSPAGALYKNMTSAFPRSPSPTLADPVSPAAVGHYEALATERSVETGAAASSVHPVEEQPTGHPLHGGEAVVSGRKEPAPGYSIGGLLGLSLNSSRGLYSDRTYTVFDTSLALLAARGPDEYAFNGRWRYSPNQDLAGNIPAYYVTEAWYRRRLTPRYTLTTGRHYLPEAAGELLDGAALDARVNERFSLGAFFGFRPAPYDFAFRNDALTAGIYSRWKGSENRFFSREALVFNSLRGRADRAFFAWEAGGALAETLSMRQLVTADFNLDKPGVDVTNYSLQAAWQPVRDLRVTWDGRMYRGIFYYVGSAGIPADTSPIYGTSLNLNYVFTRNLISTSSVVLNHRGSDHRESLSYAESIDLPDIMGSGANVNLSYSATDYYNAYFDSYSVSLSRQFFERLLLSFSTRYQRNVAETSGDKNESAFLSYSLGMNCLINDKYDLSGYFEHQRASLYNGTTEGLGFIRDPNAVSTVARDTGHNFLVLLNRRF
jgi:hypothetical protein